MLLLLAATAAGATDFDKARQMNLPLGTNSYPDEIRHYLAAADDAIARHDYTALAKLLREPGSTPRMMAGLDWGQGNMMMGSSVVVPALYAEQLWSIGSTAPADSPYAALKDTAAMVMLYTLSVIATDGPQCADKSAPASHFNHIVSRLAPLLRGLTRLPAAKKQEIVHAAMAVEAKTAPMRGQDDYLCRMDSADPKFMAEQDWRPQQAEIRDRLQAMLTGLLDRDPGQPGDRR